MRIVEGARLSGGDLAVFVVLTCASTLVILAFSSRWFSSADWTDDPASFLILSVIVFLKVANSQVRWFTLPLMKRPAPMAPRRGLRVAVVTTVVPGAEPLDMLETTVRALAALDYPHEIWVLDEGDDREVGALCRRNGVQHFSRKSLTQYQADDGPFQARSKHGNYNAWLHAIGFERYDVVATFDPDHVPVPAFLSSVLGYFEDPRVGYVQAAQAYYNQRASFIARGAAEETYEYYSCTQMAAFGFGRPAVVGCHNTHRVEALREVGGFAAHDADDLLLGLRYGAHGWHGVYIPRILARGVAPVDWQGYLTQQHRWARSVIDVNWRLTRLVGRRPAPLARALSAVHGVFYMQNSLTALLGVGLLIYLIVSGHVPAVVGPGILPPLAMLCATLQLCAFYRQRFYLDPPSEWGTHWRAGLLRYAKWPFFVWALCEVAVGRRVPYVLTRKVRAASGSPLLVGPQLLVVVVVCASFGIASLRGQSVPTPLYWVAGAVIAMSLSLIVTNLFRFPAPYDEKLLLAHGSGGAKTS